ncbi:MAG: recombination protein RecR [Alphaproteobacteria bacterium]|nr:recombination protein RecR [Alphaproteobacteria bacterium]MBV8548437.1 recombination protein RecR [Alphaproteobacteria bacterium]
MLSPLEQLIQLLAKLPGLGPRSARRSVLHLLKRREVLMQPLIDAMQNAAEQVKPCGTCGNLSDSDPCPICRDPARQNGVLCVVEDVADIWALERSHAFRGRYHVLGGTLSALEGIRPEDLRIDALITRLNQGDLTEVILALNATVEGQTTAHYVAERLAATGVTITRLAHGLPVGGELDYLDDGTLIAAFQSRRKTG